MNQKKIILIASITGLLLAFLLFLFINRNNENKASQESISPTTAAYAPSSQTKTYQDPAGFTMSYPDDFMIEKKDATDEATYSILELTNDSIEGNIKIVVEDTTAKDELAWLKANAEKTTKNPDPAKLGNLDAKSLIGTENITTVAIDQGIAFVITTSWEKTEDKSTWVQVHKQILTTFSFEQPEQAAPAESGAAAPVQSGGGEEEIEFEGEEVIE